MTALLGEFALAGAMLAAMAVIVAGVLYLLVELTALLRLAKLGMLVVAGCFSVSMWALTSGLIDNDFHLKYVLEHSEAALPIGYKIAALWAGQEGSLLLWGWMVALMAVVVAFTQIGDDTKESAVTTMTLSVVLAFFATLLLLAANPFQPAAEGAMVDGGEGLNPLLQNLAMVAHPPTLFLGYAGFTVPFAMMIGALATGRRGGGWVAAARPWVLFAWVSLTVGIVLGAQWAYVVLGWGGYWAWDPVENASLLPWFTGTALLHSLIVQRKRGIFRRWTAGLTAVSFLLCFFGTYLTRSGIQSVHSFEASAIATFLLGFLVVVGVGSVVLIAVRWNGLLRPEMQMEALISREGTMLACNVLLVAMMLVTVAGTTFPMYGKWFGQAGEVGKPFFNKTVLPLGLLLAAIMAVAPVLGYGTDALRKAKWSLLVTVGTGLVAGVATAAGIIVWHVLMSHGQSISEVVRPMAWTVAVTAVVAAALVGVVADFVVMLIMRAQSNGENVALAGLMVMINDHRRWAGHVVHIGLASLILGVVGSSLYETKTQVQLHKGESMKVAGYTVTYQSFARTQRTNHIARTATLLVTDAFGNQTILQPERRNYFKVRDPDQSYSEVGIDFGLGRDFYTILAGYTQDGDEAAFEILVNPLVNWIWIGGILMTLGGLAGLLPRMMPTMVPVPPPPVRKGRIPVVAGV